MTTKEERVLELELKKSEYEHFLEFELEEIKKVENQLEELELQVKKLMLEKRNMSHQVTHYEMLILATEARLQALKQE